MNLREAIAKWRESPPYEGVRVASLDGIWDFDEETQVKIWTILEAMDWPQVVFFEYSGSERLVAPFVVGVSSEGNPLMRGYQLQGVSKSGKGPGWRVFQIVKMSRVESYQDFFNEVDLDFEEYYPWVYKVFKML